METKKLGFFRNFFHNFLGWHTPDESKEQWTDGCQIHAICKYCGQNIMQDSQGHWI